MPEQQPPHTIEDVIERIKDAQDTVGLVFDDDHAKRLIHDAPSEDKVAVKVELLDLIGAAISAVGQISEFEDHPDLVLINMRVLRDTLKANRKIVSERIEQLLSQKSNSGTTTH